MTDLITFDRFVPDGILGETTLDYTPALASGWSRIFGSTPAGGASCDAEAAGIAVVMMMRAYLKVVTPRPPGNVHARQHFTLNTPPQIGESIRTVVRCLSKEMKRERRWVELGVEGTGSGGRAIYAGTLTLIWAA